MITRVIRLLIITTLFSLILVSNSLNNSNIIISEYSYKDIKCLAKNIYFESRGEPIKGRYAVAQVTLNRVNSNKFPNNICDVVYQNKQFSWTIKQPHKPKGKAWENSLYIAYDFLINQSKIEELDGVMHFHADYVDPYWAKSFTRVKKIGRHIFYK